MKLRVSAAALATVTVAPAVLLSSSALDAPAPADAPGGAPLAWSRHVQNYPGGLTSALRPLVSAQATAVVAAGGTAGSAGLDNHRRAAGRNRQINTDSAPPLPQTNPAVAVSLDHPLDAVAAINDKVGYAYQIMRTHDGGRTWRSVRQETQLPTGEQCPVRTPSLDYSRRDHAFYLAASCATSSGASVVQLWRSTDNGATWTPPLYAAQAVSNVDPTTGEPDTSLFYDWHRIAIDNTPTSPHYGRIYLTWTKFHILPSGESDYYPAQVAYTDHVPLVPSKAVFSVHPVGPDGGTPHGIGRYTAAWTKVAVQPDGSVLSFYAQEGCNSSVDSHLRIARSTDGGVSFGPPVRIDRLGQFKDNPDPNDVLPDKSASLGIAPSISVSPRTGTIAVAYQNNIARATSGADIWVSTSRDHGRTWRGTALSTGSAGHPARNDQFLSFQTADPRGRFWAIWLDNRRDPGNHLINTFEATSGDDAHHWSSRRLSSKASDPDHTAIDGSSILGVGTAIAASRAAVYPIWPDARQNAYPVTGIGDIDLFTDVELRH